MSLRNPSRAVLGAVVVATLGALVGARQGVATSHVWWQTDGGQNWVGQSISLGAFGEQVFVGCDVNHPALSLAVTHDALPQARLWSIATGSEQPLVVDSAEQVDVHVSISEEDATSVNERIIRVRKFRSSSSTPEWTYTYPLLTAGHQAVGVSDDGETVLALISNPTANGRYDVLRFDGASSTPTWIESLPATGVGGPLWRVDVARSGKFIAANIGDVSYLFDVERRGVVFSLDNGGMLSEIGVAVAADGSAFAIGGGAMRVFERDAQGSYVETYAHHASDGAASRIAISALGETVAWSILRGYPSSLVDVYALDLRTKRVVLHDQHGGASPEQNVINGLAISADGRRIAAGELGDPLGLPEVHVYEVGRDLPIATFELRGGVEDVDISADGQWVASAGADCHSPCGPFGRFDLFRIGGADLDYVGVPHLGASVDVSTWGSPGELATLLFAPGLLGEPRAVPGVGDVFVPSSELRAIVLGVVPADGHLVATLPLPSDAGLLGRTFGMQVAFGAPYHAVSKSWSTVTLVP